MSGACVLLPVKWVDGMQVDFHDSPQKRIICPIRALEDATARPGSLTLNQGFRMTDKSECMFLQNHHYLYYVGSITTLGGFSQIEAAGLLLREVKSRVY